jgi:hypothetical protein
MACEFKLALTCFAGQLHQRFVGKVDDLGTGLQPLHFARRLDHPRPRQGGASLHQLRVGQFLLDDTERNQRQGALLHRQPHPLLAAADLLQRLAQRCNKIVPRHLLGKRLEDFEDAKPDHLIKGCLLARGGGVVLICHQQAGRRSHANQRQGRPIVQLRQRAKLHRHLVVAHIGDIFG